MSSIAWRKEALDIFLGEKFFEVRKQLRGILVIQEWTISAVGGWDDATKLRSERGRGSRLSCQSQTETQIYFCHMNVRSYEWMNECTNEWLAQLRCEYGGGGWSSYQSQPDTDANISPVFSNLAAVMCGCLDQCNLIEEFTLLIAVSQTCANISCGRFYVSRVQLEVLRNSFDHQPNNV